MAYTQIAVERRGAVAWLFHDRPEMRNAESSVLLDELDAVVREAGGAVYPAKDARMSRESFRAFFPALDRFMPHRDSRFSSSFWRRVHGD